MQRNITARCPHLANTAVKTLHSLLALHLCYRTAQQSDKLLAQPLSHKREREGEQNNNKARPKADDARLRDTKRYSLYLSLGSRTRNEVGAAPASAARQPQQCRHQRVVVLLRRRQRRRRQQRQQRNPGHRAEAAAGRVCLSVRRQLLCD